MPTLVAHAVSGLAVNSLLPQREYSKRTAVLCALCAVIPDIDAIGFRFGIPFDHWLGHRGMTHSVLFAMLLGVALSFLAAEKQQSTKRRMILFAAFFFSGLSHDLLDATTDGGPGIAFFSPVDHTRYFLPWRPIEVSPFSAAGLFSRRGLAVLKSELIWVLLPSLFVMIAARLRRLQKQTGKHCSSSGRQTSKQKTMP